MVFNSMDFLLFFPIVVLIYYAVPRKIKWVWLLIASLYFYMCWSVKYSVLLAFSVGTTYAAAMMIGKSDAYAGKKQVYLKRFSLASCIVMNVLILFVFKYGNFMLENLGYLGFENLPCISFALPVGISFYTFQAIGYLADVYKGKCVPEKNFGKYALFVTFFPVILSGPIERASNLLKQIHEEHKFNYRQVKDGLIFMAWGLFQKIVIADRAAIVVDTVWRNYEDFPGVWLLLAAVLFSVQIYCDFGGYSNMAIGAAKVMGFELTHNFDTPYFAQSIKEFWRRWHISLSSWLRDYIYIPLGGSRCSKTRKYFNLLITFGVSGLWHGANWTYVVWGLLHGTYQIAGEITTPLRNKIKTICSVKDTGMFVWLSRLFTFGLVTFAWIFFKAPSLTDAVEFIKGIGTNFEAYRIMDLAQWGTLGITMMEMLFLLTFILCLFVVSILHGRESVTEQLERQNPLERWIIYMALVWAIIMFGVYGMDYVQTQFIYFQF